MKISIITLNYNNTAVTLDMLKSLEGYDRTFLEVVVVDNGSINPPHEIARQFPWVKYIRSGRNLGFAGGNNLGVQYATGEYLFFVNNDTEFTAPIHERLAAILDRDRSIGIISPVLHYYEQPRSVQYAGYTRVSNVTGRNACIREVNFTEPTETSYAHGAAMMMHRDVYQQIGPMPENYFVYYEELDWSERTRRIGYRIVVDPQSTLLHKESRTVAKMNEMKAYFMSRNRILFMRRNRKSASLPLFWLFYVLLATPKQLVGYILDNQWAQIRAHVAGIIWNLKHDKDSEILGYKFNFLKQYDAAI